MTHARCCEDCLYIFHPGTGRIHGTLKPCCVSVVFFKECVGELFAFWVLLVFLYFFLNYLT